jgi:H+/gluconate symporter-like permease
MLKGASVKPVAVKWLKYLIAIALGQSLYFFVLYPHLPPAARHQPYKLDLGVLVDFWLCLFFLGLLELGAFLYRRGKR